MIPSRERPRERATPRRKRGIGGTVFVFLILSGLALLFFQSDSLRDGVAALVEREPGEAVFPLPPEYAGSFTNDWGAPREQGGHEGTDVYAPQGTPIYSVTSGTVTTAYGSDDDGWNTLGGYTVMVRADRDSGQVRRGDRLYYAHMAEASPLEDGERVEAGERLGTVGNTAGEAPGSLGDFPTHLHLGWYAGAGSIFSSDERRAAPFEAINPYPLLRYVVNE